MSATKLGFAGARGAGDDVNSRHDSRYGEVSPRRRALTKRCAWRVVSGTRVGPAQRRTSAMALARSQRWPTETKTGDTPARVRRAAPTVSPRWTSGAQSPGASPTGP